MNISRYHKTLIAAAAAVTLGVGATACTDNTGDHSPMTENSSSSNDAQSDSAITARIKTELANDSDFRSSGINVSTSRGVVTMEGSVANADAKSAAERVASSVSGVSRVNNRLSASSTNTSSRNMNSDGAGTMQTAANDAQEYMSDAWITTKVKSSLLADSDAKGFDVSVDTVDGVVTLTGDLNVQDDIDHVEDIAAGIDGVKRINVTALTVSSRR